METRLKTRGSRWRRNNRTFKLPVKPQWQENYTIISDFSTIGLSVNKHRQRLYAIQPNNTEHQQWLKSALGGSPQNLGARPQLLGRCP